MRTRLRSADTASLSLTPGQRVEHPQLGEGVVVRLLADGQVQAFFPGGERPEQRIGRIRRYGQK